MYAIDKHLYCVVSGLSADANYLINLLREYAQVVQWLLRIIESNTDQVFPLRRLLSIFAILSNTTHKLEAPDLLELLSCLLDMTKMVNSSFTQLTLQGTTQDGRLRPLVATILRLTLSSNSNIKMIWLWSKD